MDAGMQPSVHASSPNNLARAFIWSGVLTSPRKLQSEPRVKLGSVNIKSAFLIWRVGLELRETADGGAKYWLLWVDDHEAACVGASLASGVTSTKFERDRDTVVLGDVGWLGRCLFWGGESEYKRIEQTAGLRKEHVHEMVGQSDCSYQILVSENDDMEAQCQQTRTERDASKPRLERSLRVKKPWWERREEKRCGDWRGKSVKRRCDDAAIAATLWFVYIYSHSSHLIICVIDLCFIIIGADILSSDYRF